nr:hypothetical protein [Rhodococcus oxybenzonivorans]
MWVEAWASPGLEHQFVLEDPEVGVAGDEVGEVFDDVVERRAGGDVGEYARTLVERVPERGVEEGVRRPGALRRTASSETPASRATACVVSPRRPSRAITETVARTRSRST